MDSKTIQKYSKYSLPKLKEKATKHFNAFIRRRDAECTCISCGQRKPLQAGHFYSAGHYPVLRFNENNVHGQCMRCNFYLSANLINYRVNLIEKIGREAVEELDEKVKVYNQFGHKWERFTLIEIIEKYKTK